MFYHTQPLDYSQKIKYNINKFKRKVIKMSDVMLGALYVGLITGAIPAIVGATKGKFDLGMIGFIACLVSGLILGLLLAIPVCAFFVFKICNEQTTTNKENSRFCTNCGCEINKDTNFCPKCGIKTVK